MSKRKLPRRRYRHIVAGMTGAMLLTAAMMNTHAPTAKAAPAWETMLPEGVGEVIGKSRDNIEERVKESIKDNINKKIEEKKAEWSKEILEKLTTPLVSKANKVIEEVTATAYTSGYEDNGKWKDKTHIGSKVRRGIVAVDPSVIPLGTKLYIEFADGQGMYATAEDTGSAIKGKKIDIALADKELVDKFGIQTVKVHILEEPANHLA